MIKEIELVRGTTVKWSSHLKQLCERKTRYSLKIMSRSKGFYSVEENEKIVGIHEGLEKSSDDE